MQADVVYKPLSGERPLWDFPDGTLAGREVATALIAEAAEIVARADLRTAGRATDRTELSQTVVLGTVLGDRMLAGLRRMAQEHLARLTASAPTPLLTEEHS